MVLPGDLQFCWHQHTAVKTGQNAGILPVHPTVRFFLEAQQIIPLTAKVIHHL
ncbi:hypothetical protein OFO29_19885 [Escherichia coli]|nr:hypothetical protein [Escherichia coli]MCV5959931.1 hypothetical protein [Escherichia coli]MCV5974704.1 hypothetical protein [Escherichia coli]